MADAEEVSARPEAKRRASTTPPLFQHRRAGAAAGVRDKSPRSTARSEARRQRGLHQEEHQQDDRGNGRDVGGGSTSMRKTACQSNRRASRPRSGATTRATSRPKGWWSGSATAIAIAAEPATDKRLSLADTMGWANPVADPSGCSRDAGLVARHASACICTTRAARASSTRMAALEMGSTFRLGGRRARRLPVRRPQSRRRQHLHRGPGLHVRGDGHRHGHRPREADRCRRLAEEVVGHPLPGKLLRGGTLNPDRRGGKAGRARLKGGRRRWRSRHTQQAADRRSS